MNESLHGMVVTFAQLRRTLQPCHARIHGQGGGNRRRTHPVGDAEAVGGDGERRVAKRFAALAPAPSRPPRFMAAMRDVPHRLHAAKAWTGGRLWWSARWLYQRAKI